MFVKAYDGTLLQVSEESPVVITGLSFVKKQLREFTSKHKIKQGSKLKISYKDLVFTVSVKYLSRYIGSALVRLNTEKGEKIDIVNF